MYDEVMQLIALAKNDEEYFKRIEALKQQMLELAQVKEIAKTLGEADMHLANARQKADQVISDAEQEAKVIRQKANSYVEQQKSKMEKAELKLGEAEDKLEGAVNMAKETADKSLKLDEAIAEHRKLTAERNTEYEAYKKARVEFETKLKAIKEIANS